MIRFGAYALSLASLLGAAASHADLLPPPRPVGPILPAPGPDRGDGWDGDGGWDRDRDSLIRNAQRLSIDTMQLSRNFEAEFLRFGRERFEEREAANLLRVFSHEANEFEEIARLSLEHFHLRNRFEDLERLFRRSQDALFRLGRMPYFIQRQLQEVRMDLNSIQRELYTRRSF